MKGGGEVGGGVLVRHANGCDHDDAGGGDRHRNVVGRDAEHGSEAGPEE